MAEPGGAVLPAADGRNDPAGLRRIVVVDDEPELCRVLMEYLTWLPGTRGRLRNGAGRPARRGGGGCAHS